MSTPEQVNGDAPDQEYAALAGLRVVDMASLYAGPLIATILADFGADVVKVEHPRGDDARRWGRSRDGVPLWWKVISRNKDLIALDLHRTEDRDIARDLCAWADVVIENFRPGRLESWQMGYDDLAARNPGLVMVRVTGFGQTGPYADRPGFGTLAEAFSGFAAITGTADGPPTLPPFGLADGVAALTGTSAVLAALRWRDRQGAGRGQDVAGGHASLRPMRPGGGPEPVRAAVQHPGTAGGRVRPTRHPPTPPGEPVAPHRPP